MIYKVINAIILLLIGIGYVHIWDKMKEQRLRKWYEKNRPTDIDNTRMDK